MVGGTEARRYVVIIPREGKKSLCHFYFSKKGV